MSIRGDWDRRISRRTLLKTGGSFAAGATLAGLGGVRAFAQSSYPFTLGVASGDPGQNGVVLWTRLAPDPLAVGGGLPAEPYEVRYEVAKDDGFQKIVRTGSTVALPDEAHSARVELFDLGPQHEYFYRFKPATTSAGPAARGRRRPATPWCRRSRSRSSPARTSRTATSPRTRTSRTRATSRRSSTSATTSTRGRRPSCGRTSRGGRS